MAFVIERKMDSNRDDVGWIGKDFFFHFRNVKNRMAAKRKSGFAVLKSSHGCTWYGSRRGWRMERYGADIMEPHSHGFMG